MLKKILCIATSFVLMTNVTQVLATTEEIIHARQNAINYHFSTLPVESSTSRTISFHVPSMESNLKVFYENNGFVWTRILISNEDEVLLSFRVAPSEQGYYAVDNVQEGTYTVNLISVGGSENLNGFLSLGTSQYDVFDEYIATSHPEEPTPMFDAGILQLGEQYIIDSTNHWGAIIHVPTNHKYFEVSYDNHAVSDIEAQLFVAEILNDDIVVVDNNRIAINFIEIPSGQSDISTLYNAGGATYHINVQTLDPRNIDPNAILNGILTTRSYEATEYDIITTVEFALQKMDVNDLLVSTFYNIYYNNEPVNTSDWNTNINIVDNHDLLAVRYHNTSDSAALLTITKDGETVLAFRISPHTFVTHDNIPVSIEDEFDIYITPMDETKTLQGSVIIASLERYY